MGRAIERAHGIGEKYMAGVGGGRGTGPVRKGSE
jgi:hypothetical protein